MSLRSLLTLSSPPQGSCAVEEYSTFYSAPMLLTRWCVSSQDALEAATTIIFP